MLDELGATKHSAARSRCGNYRAGIRMGGVLSHWLQITQGLTDYSVCS